MTLLRGKVNPCSFVGAQRQSGENWAPGHECLHSIVECCLHALFTLCYWRTLWFDPCWAWASNSVEMKSNLCEPNFPSTTNLLLSLSLSHLPVCCEEMHSTVLKSASGNPLWQALRCVKKWRRALPGTDTGGRPCLSHTAGTAVFYVLLIYTHSCLLKHIRRNMPSQTLSGLSHHISPEARQVFNFFISKYSDCCVGTKWTLVQAGC